MVPDQLLKTLWLGRLPTQIQTILATRPNDPLAELAEQADRIYEVTLHNVASTSATSATSHTSSAPQLKKATLSLEEQIQQLTKKVEKLIKERKKPPSQNKEKTDNPKYCYYHNKFGEKARKCTQPCTYKKTENK